MIATASQPTIPLLPRRRVAGRAHGTLRSARRGNGGDIAGSRTYAPGDDVRQIDRRASARLSLALDRDEFVVHEQYAEEATYVVLLEDARPSMRLFAADLPWLCKPAAVSEIRTLLAASAARVRCQFRRSRTPDLGSGLEVLRAARIGSGSFVFLVSDFLEPPTRDLLDVAAGRGWDLVPVVVQDPTWERSFPDVGRIALRVVDPETGDAAAVYLTYGECRARRAENEERFDSMIALARDHGLEPVVLSSHSREDVYGRFREWAETRRIELRRRC